MGKRKQIKTFFICPKFRGILLRIMSNREFKWENYNFKCTKQLLAGYCSIYIFYVAKKKCSDIGNIGNKTTDTDIVILGPIYRYADIDIGASLLSYHILSYPILSYPILSYPVLPYLILSYPILPILSYSFLSFLSYVVSYAILSYPKLSCPILSHPVLSLLSYNIQLLLIISCSCSCP